MDKQPRLPPTFRSLYRLFLRTASATVLHHRQARRNLRQRWRPVFDAGAKVSRELQNAPTDASESWIKGREDWLRVWNKRMDNTLSFLYTASQSRGQPHKVTRNLAFMVGNERERLISKYARMHKWDPVSPKVVKPKLIEESKKAEQFQNNAKLAFDEVVRFAEASGGGMTLGTTEFPLVRLFRSYKPNNG
ncbi:hypothetical protein JR316_0002624 [Psilocybe cubensis]|uniref:Uncharacterized protein n=2 Tax=Psilocybe cubensis TaxID=181762 RepID=A0A8H7Y8L6_PSICU|nr:hypothetical protein JR316_0002624 [Psilocybe cubensis]KAH9485711.1 hypothetical protein JR316_0002624 [Psilocybe cubensis]